MKRRLASAALFAMLLFEQSSLWAAALELNAGDIKRDAQGLTISLGLAVRPEENVASFQFDLRFDPAVLHFEKVAASSQTESAQKLAHWNLVAPGRVRVVVAGLNRNIIPSGNVLEMHFAGAPTPGRSTSLSLSDAILSDPFGVSITLDDVQNTLLLDANSAATLQDEPRENAGFQAMQQFASRNAAVLLAMCAAAVFLWYITRTPSSARGRKSR
jgi:hypothetical protein